MFEGFSIWKEEKYRKLQGTYPVISLSFARVKEDDYATTREKICQIICAAIMEKKLSFFWMNMDMVNKRIKSNGGMTDLFLENRGISIIHGRF